MAPNDSATMYVYIYVYKYTYICWPTIKNNQFLKHFCEESIGQWERRPVVNPCQQSQSPKISVQL